MAFVHLHTHTQYSLLDGSNKITEYISRVKDLGMSAAAITDHGAMFGVIDFYKEAKKAGINPVIGCEVYVAPHSRFDKESSRGDERYYHLILLAENNTGYQNLMKIVSKGYTEGFYFKPRVDFELLSKYHEGIIALSACIAGEIPRNILKDDYESAKQIALKYRDCFGEGNFFLEIQDHGLAEEKKVISQLIRLSSETGIELVATNDAHYTYEEDAASHDILLCIQTGKSVYDTDRMKYEGGQYYVKSEEEMRTLFAYAPEAIDNTQKIADRCHVEIEFGVTKLPKFEVPDGFDSWTYLNHLCYKGLKERYKEDSDKLKERLDYELGVIKKMGYVDYFLIVWDFIHYAKQHDIMVGPGRGSAAGSIVAYTMGITNVDPIQYNLLFERFLNPERVSMPDIDIDFCYENRSKVIKYVVDKYGKEQVTQIVTFGTLLAKGVIRAVGKALDLPYAQCDEIAKSIPNELGITIADALIKNPMLKKKYDTDSTIRNLIDTSMKLEGLPRHTSMHAAGVVISQKAMDEYVPLSLGADGTVVTQFTMTTIEELGLLKMDFLGLRTLTVIQNAVKMAEKRAGKKIDIDNIDFNDKKVYDLISSGKTQGVFQLESQGMKEFMKELSPNSLEDVIAGISLYRPGPMDFIPSYIEGKNNPDKITYDCPQLEPILKATYGCIVYQEQVMQIVRDLAGYTLGRSDLVRRAMSKKKADVMNKERQNFVYGNKEEGVPGCIANGISEEVANKIFDEMTDFARYAFNKSHAACYAVVAYETAYLKCYYPVEYMAALMTSVLDNPPKVSEYIATCRQMGIKVLPPDINSGEASFTAANGNIIFSLMAIKNVGEPVVNAIVRNRNEFGAYSSLEDFLTRCAGDGIVNKRAVENFIKAGAFDNLMGNRHQYMIVYEDMMNSIHKEKKSEISGQMSFLDFVDEEDKADFAVKLPDVEEFDKEVLLSYEKEVTGVYISGHPLEEYTQKIEKNVTAKASDFMLNDESGECIVKDKSEAVVGGIIDSVKIKYTKNNKIMAFVTLEDVTGTIEVIVFPTPYQKNAALISEDKKVFIKGRVDVEEDRGAKLICDSMLSFEEVGKRLWLQFESENEYKQYESRLDDYFDAFHGIDDIFLYFKDVKKIKACKHAAIRIDDELDETLKKMLGANNVKIVEKKGIFR